MSKTGFYSAFEDRYRGSRELIKSQFGIYVTFVKPLREIYKNTIAIDLGCGRGEWLELADELGFNVRGVDLDDGMLAVCHEHRLNACEADALDTLQKLPDESVGLLSAFHLVEHMTFDKIQSLVREALRVLVPGGLLILETPNPENILVGAFSFYLDPSHIKPIPPLLLSFMVEYAGFHRNKVVRLHELSEFSITAGGMLYDMLGNVSPDYSVVAQKKAPTEVLSKFDESFNVNYGISLETIRQFFNQYTESSKLSVEQQLAQTKKFMAELNIVKEYSVQLQFRTQKLQNELAAAEWRMQQAEAMAQQAATWFFRRKLKPTREDVVAAYHCFLGREPESEMVVFGYMQKKTIGKLIASFMNSKEFRMRMHLNVSSRLEASNFFPTLKRFPGNFFVLVDHFFRIHPELRFRCVDLIRRLGFYDSFKSFYFKCLSQKYSKDSLSPIRQSIVSVSKIDQLTARASQVYVDLKTAIEHHKKGNG
jgi:O-antigen chain-terminating methyltransferase